MDDLNPLGITGIRPMRNVNSMVTNSDGTVVRASVIHGAAPILQLHEDLQPGNLSDVEFVMEEDVNEIILETIDDWSVLDVGTSAHDQPGSIPTATVGRASAPPPGPVQATHPGVLAPRVRGATASAPPPGPIPATHPGVLAPRVRGATASTTSSDSGTAVPPSILTPRVSVAAATGTPHSGRGQGYTPRSLNLDDRVADRLARGSARTSSRPVASDSTASENVNEAILDFYKQEKIGRRKVRYFFFKCSVPDPDGSGFFHRSGSGFEKSGSGYIIIYFV